MPRDAFVSTGFSFDPRDFFPLAYTGGITYGVDLSLDGWMEVVRRIRTFAVSYSVTSDLGSKAGAYVFDNLSNGLGLGPPADETQIDCFVRNLATCGFNGFDTYSHFECTYYGYNVSGSYVYTIQPECTAMSVIGGDPGVDNSPGPNPSLVSCNFLGLDIPMFDNDAAHPCHGSIAITGNSWWARDDGTIYDAVTNPFGGPIWNTATGALIRNPVPAGLVGP